MKSLLKAILFLSIALTLVACDKPGSRIMGKWHTKSEMAEYFGADQSKISSRDIVEFTETERINNGKRVEIELVDDGDKVIMYRKFFGQKMGTTFKFIDKDTFVDESAIDKLTYHRLK